MSTHAVQASATIDASPETVFAILADPRQHARIDGSGTVQATVSGPERLQLDSTFRMDMRQGLPYRIRNRVVEFEEGRLIAWRHVGPHRWRYELEPLEEGRTRVTETWDVSRYPRAGRRVLALLGLPEKTQRAIEQTLVKLAAAAEADAA